jgi:hypothetical protein
MPYIIDPAMATVLLKEQSKKEIDRGWNTSRLMAPPFKFAEVFLKWVSVNLNIITSSVYIRDLNIIAPP